MDLDAKFGIAITPNKIGNMEAKQKPRSLHRLDAVGAKLLLRFMSATEQGLRITQYVYSDIPILWAVDESGDIWFSIEEIVDQTSGNFVRAKMKMDPVPDNSEKLGHPSLLPNQKAGRIAGEILYDFDGVRSYWTITNASGRYGVATSRASSHLENAAEMFRSYGINLVSFFYEPRA